MRPYLLVAAALLGCSDPKTEPAAPAPLAAAAAEDAQPSHRWAFEAAGDFAPLPTPQPGDWLAEHEEAGQTFAQYVESKPNLPVKGQDKIYVLPIGDLAGGPSLADLADYASRFFGLEVEVLPAVTVEDTRARTRMNDGVKQLLAPSVMAYLRGKIPADAYCLIGLTMVDLYPEESWNFVFGEASLVNRVGVFSFARNDSAFYGGHSDAATIRRRAMQVMTHEIGHMFGIQHCIHYSCNMNGSNSLQESDRQPAHFCPVCLRKLQHAAGFDPAQRYERLIEFYDRTSMADQATFARTRLARSPASGRRRWRRLTPGGRGPTSWSEPPPCG